MKHPMDHFMEFDDQAARVEITPPHALMTHRIGWAEGSITLEAELNPVLEPFLRDHAMNGIPLFPGVMGIEGFCVAAKMAEEMLVDDGYDYRIRQVEDVQFNLPLKFYRDQPRRVLWMVQMIERDGRLVAQVQMEAILARYGREPETNVYFSGNVVLERDGNVAEVPEVDMAVWDPNTRTLPAKDIYQLLFHGPAFQVLESVQKLDGGILAKFNSHLPALTASASRLVSQPMLMELCLQAAGICEIGRAGVLALPKAIDRVKWLGSVADGRDLFAKVSLNEDVDGQMRHDMRVIDAAGNVYLEMSNYQTQALPYMIDDERLGIVQNWFRQ